METADIRKDLHELIDKADMKLLKLLLAIAKAYNGKPTFNDNISATGLS